MSITLLDDSYDLIMLLLYLSLTSVARSSPNSDIGTKFGSSFSLFLIFLTTIHAIIIETTRTIVTIMIIKDVLDEESTWSLHFS